MIIAVTRTVIENIRNVQSAEVLARVTEGKDRNIVQGSDAECVSILWPAHPFLRH